jgi:hypothetical protein
MRSDSSCAITRAASRLPAKLTEAASGDRQTDVNFGAADATVTITTATKLSGMAYRMGLTLQDMCHERMKRPLPRHGLILA